MSTVWQRSPFYHSSLDGLCNIRQGIILQQISNLLLRHYRLHEIAGIIDIDGVLCCNEISERLRGATSMMGK